MNLKRIALITEIVGGVGILATLIILLFEVRENNSLVDRQMRLDRADLSVSLMVNSPYLPGILAKIKAVDSDSVGSATTALMSRYNLTFEEADRFVRYLRRQWFGFEADYFAGTPDLDRVVRNMLTFPDQALYWEYAQKGLNENFAKYVNDLND